MPDDQLQRKRRKRDQPQHTLAGVCKVCGLPRDIAMATWKRCRGLDTWPRCRSCAGWMFPVRRTCLDCGASLRDGNLGVYCAVCVRRRLEAN